MVARPDGKPRGRTFPDRCSGLKPLFTFRTVIFARFGGIFGAEGERDIAMAHCLIVDDSRVIRTVARRILEDLHFIAAEAEDGMSALRAAREKMPDLILLDWSMPGMTGGQLAKAALALRPDLPIVLATGYADLPPGAGIDLPRLGKPYTQDQLAVEIAKALK